MVRVPLLEASQDALVRLESVRVATLFGSQARNGGDALSDVDLQVITARPRDFDDASWLDGFPYPVQAYGRRPASGGVTKATAVLAGGGELDVVVLPLGRLRLARLLVALSLHRRSRLVRLGLEELARILRPGHRVLIGSDGWRQFLAQVVAEVPEPRLSDRQVQDMGACAFADFISMQRKAARGELLAVQRVLHVNLAETNFRLMHERRLRHAQVSFRDARRVEQLLAPEDCAAIRVEARLAPEALVAAGAAALGTTRRLVQDLTGQEPGWPPV